MENFVSNLPKVAAKINSSRMNLPEAALEIKSYHRDIVLNFKYSSCSSIKINNQHYGRGTIKDFSFRSMRRLKLVSRNVAYLMRVTIDLTYPGDFPVDGKTVKNHLSKFRKRLKRLGINYFWVLEFQERGAPHFHLMVDRRVDKEIVSKMWYEVVESGDERHLKAGTRVQAIKDEGRVIRYISSYMKKLTQKTVPDEFKNVGRFWGYSSNILKVWKETLEGSREELNEKISYLIEWYKEKLSSWGIKDWEWGGSGLIVWEGSEVACVLRI